MVFLGSDPKKSFGNFLAAVDDEILLVRVIIGGGVR